MSDFHTEQKPKKKKTTKKTKQQKIFSICKHVKGLFCRLGNVWVGGGGKKKKSTNTDYKTHKCTVNVKVVTEEMEQKYGKR